MRIRLSIFICVAFINSIAFLSGCSGYSGSKGQNINYTEAQSERINETSPDWVNQSTKESETTAAIKETRKSESTPPVNTKNEGTKNRATQSGGIKSGATSNVPWENDSNFKQAKSKYGTNTLMAAYRTVLHDPLPGEEYNVHLAARLLSGRVVKPGKTFSQNNSIGPYTQARGFKKGPTYIGTKLATTTGGGVCKIASTLYNVTVLSNLQVVERYAHSMPVPYVPYGQDATVSYGVHDFKFVNNTSDSVLIWAQGIDNILYVAFYGKTTPPDVQWHHDMQRVKKAKVVYKINSDLKPGVEKVTHEGMNGALVKSWVTIKNAAGGVAVKAMGTSKYSPMPQIIEKGE